MELGAHVWLRKEDSQWGWVPAVITRKESSTVRGVELINLTLSNDPLFEANGNNNLQQQREESQFEVVVTVDPEQLKTADHDDIKLRNMPSSFHLADDDQQQQKSSECVVGGVDDLIGLTHLHEPAILHALRLRYNSDIIYTATGPILIAVNPFKKMNLYSDNIMESYCQQGEKGSTGNNSSANNSNYQTPFKNRRAFGQSGDSGNNKRLSPHVYQTADDAYRAMLRGLENRELMRTPAATSDNTVSVSPSNQSILVSGESGAGKTVTTKIVLNYFAMLSKRRATQPSPSGRNNTHAVEQQVLQSNPILESFGNARTIRNDNSSRFGKYIDIRFTRSGKLVGASIDTYLLEKVRLIHPGANERNYHVFYQFLAGASAEERRKFHLGRLQAQDFVLLSQSGTFDRRDGVSDKENHKEMLNAMVCTFS